MIAITVLTVYHCCFNHSGGMICHDVFWPYGRLGRAAEREWTKRNVTDWRPPVENFWLRHCFHLKRTSVVCVLEREREFICQVDIHNIYINCNNGRLPVKALAHRSWPPRGHGYVLPICQYSFFVETLSFPDALCLFHFYRAMLCIRGTSHGPVSVCDCVCVCHKSEFY